MKYLFLLLTILLPVVAEAQIELIRPADFRYHVTVDGDTVSNPIVDIYEATHSRDTAKVFKQTVIGDENGFWEMTETRDATKAIICEAIEEIELESGTLTGVDGLDVTDTEKSIPSGEHSPKFFRATGGAGEGDERVVTANEGDTWTLNLAHSFAGNTEYEIVDQKKAGISEYFPPTQSPG